MRDREIRYSEGFKLQVVQEIEGGRWQSPHEAGQAYGVRGATTIASWLRKYGRAHLLKKVVRVEVAGEPGEMKRLKDRIRQLEGALADACMDKYLNEAYFEILCEQMKVDPEAIKKKVAGKGCIGRIGKGVSGGLP